MTTSLRPRRAALIAGACWLACVFSAYPAAGQRPARLYGVIDIERVGSDIGFSIDLAPPHAVRLYGWGFDEVEAMAVDGEGELYLFSETGEVRKVRLSAPDRPPVSVAPAGGFEFTAATTRPDGMIELFDARGGELVAFDPRRDRILPGRTRVVEPELTGLARTAAQLYGIAPTRGAVALYVHGNGGFQRTCAQRRIVPNDVEALERYTDTSLIIARISITATNQLLLHVETLEPGACAARPLLRPMEIPRDQFRRFLDPATDLDGMLSRVRSVGWIPQIEATAIVR